MCLTYTFQGLQVAEGKGELNAPAPSLRHVMSLYGSYHMAVVQKDSDIKSLADLKSKPYRVWIGPKASVFYPLNVAALAAHGVAPDLEASPPKMGPLVSLIAERARAVLAAKRG